MFGVFLGIILLGILVWRIRVEAKRVKTDETPYIIATLIIDVVMSAIALSGRFWIPLLLIFALFIPYIIISSKPYTPEPPEVDHSHHLIE